VNIIQALMHGNHDLFPIV